MKKRVLYLLAGFVSIIVIVWISFVLHNIATDNFHPVIVGKVYRSAQLSPMQLDSYIKAYHIKSIINLRNDVKNTNLLQDEIAIAKKNNIAYYLIQLPPHKTPKVSDLKLLVRVLNTAPQPILIHCKAGADRTGLASAISIILSDDKYINDFEDQISWHYNVYSGSTIGYQVMNNYLDWLVANHKANSKENFLIWLNGVNELKNYYGWFFVVK